MTTEQALLNMLFSVLILLVAYLLGYLERRLKRIEERMELDEAPSPNPPASGNQGVARPQHED